MEVGKLGYYFDPKDPLSVITKKVVRWISDQNHIWWTWKIKLSRGTNDRRSWRGVRLKNNTFMFSFYWCNTALWYFNHGIQLTQEDFRMPGLYLVRLSAKDRIKCCSWRKININVGKIRRTVPAIAALSTVAHFCEIPGLEQVFFVKTTQPTADISLFKDNNGNNRAICEIYSKLTIKTPERH